MFWKDKNRVLVVNNAAAAGTTDLTSSSVDMAADVGFDEVTFIAKFGALTATQVTQIKAQQSSDDGSADDFTDIAGSNTGPMADADSNKTLVLTLRPQKRYVRCVVDRGTANAVLDSVIAIQSMARKLPVTQSTGVSAVEAHNYPAEGTA